MTRHHFPGYPAFLDAAAVEIGRPEAAGPARRNATLAAVSGLCAQAAEASPAHVEGILAKAEEMACQLEVAYLASQTMIASLRRGCGLPQVPVSSPRPKSAASPSPLRGAARKHG